MPLNIPKRQENKASYVCKTLGGFDYSKLMLSAVLRTLTHYNIIIINY